MAQLLADLLAPAVGVAVSPVPVIAVVLMLLSPRAGTVAPAFAAGWSAGIALPATVFVLIAGTFPTSERQGSGSVGAVVRLLLGGILLLLSARQFRRRHEDATLPAWMGAIDGLGVGRSGATGLLLAAVNPKNLALAAAAGVSVAGSGLRPGAQLGATCVFVALAGSTVLLPTVAHVLQPDRLAAPLARLKGWLVTENATILSVLLFVLGVVVLGKGLGDL